MQTEWYCLAVLKNTHKHTFENIQHPYTMEAKMVYSIYKKEGIFSHGLKPYGCEASVQFLHFSFSCFLRAIMMLLQLETLRLKITKNLTSHV